VPGKPGSHHFFTVGSRSCLAFCLILLSSTGDERQTDSLGVFSGVLKLPNGTIGRWFFLHGL
jgi:hypothetical protein